MTDWTLLAARSAYIEIVENTSRALRIKVRTPELGNLFDDYLHGVLHVDYCWVHFPEDNWVFVFEDPTELTRTRVLSGIESFQAGSVYRPFGI